MGMIKNLFSNNNSQPINSDPYLSIISSFIDDDFDVDSSDAINMSNDVYSVVTKIASSISNLPISSSNQYMEDLLQKKPNPYQSGYNFESSVLINLLIYGDAFCLISTDNKNGLINRLDLLSTPQVTIMKNDQGLTYQTTDQTFSEDQILHFRLPSVDGRIGLSPLLSLKPLLRLSNDSTKTLRNYYKNGLFAKSIINVNDDLSPDNKQKLKEQFKQNMGSDSFGGAIIQDGRLINSIKPYNTSKNDSGIIKDTKIINDQIKRAVCSAYGVPESLLTTNPHANTSDEMSRFHSDIRCYENVLISELNRKFSGSFKIGNYINVNTPGDVANLAKSGAISPDQAQTLLGLH